VDVDPEFLEDGLASVVERGRPRDDQASSAARKLGSELRSWPSARVVSGSMTTR